ncbi:MAG TPA: EamA family transporter [Chloroflexota bacterium]|nr:EamA family transporter [Chloroflexota bacterium]
MGGSWIFFALLAAVFAAMVAILGKIGIGGVDTVLATALRAIVMAVFLTVVAAVQGKFALVSTVDRSALIFIVGAGVAGALSWLAYFLALRDGPASGTAALDRLSVVFVVLLAALFLGEPLTLRTGLGAALITAGALLFVLK